MAVLAFGRSDRCGDRSARSPTAAGALDAEEVTRFAWLYRRHREQEAAVVMPFAKDALAP